MTRSGIATLLGLALSLVPAAGRAADEPDPRVAWLREHAVPLKSIDPAVTDFSDLAPLKRDLSGARVVVLGEATRGDGSDFLAKTRLIQFLHREMGFDLVALECGFYACEKAWRESASPDAAKEALYAALPRFDSESAQFQPLLDLVAAARAGDRPLVAAGVEPELTGDASGFLADLRRVLRRRGSEPAAIPGFAEMAKTTSNLALEAYATGREPVPSKRARRRFARTLGEIARRLRTPSEKVPPERAPSPPDPEELAFWRQALENLGTQAEMAWRLGRYRPGYGVPPEVTSLANRQVARNVLWLAKHRAPGGKVVLWTWTPLMARHTAELETGDVDTKARLERFTTIGDVLEDALGEAAYLVAFTAYEGSWGVPYLEPTPMLAATAGSFEDLMGRTGLEAAFLDLRGLGLIGRGSEGGRWLAGPLIARPLSFKELRGSWPRHVDAFVFVRTMKPSRRP